MNRTNRDHKATHAASEGESKKKPGPKLKRRANKRTSMEIAIYVIGTVGVIVGSLAGVFFSANHRDAGVWASCVSILLFVVAGFCWYQDILWKRDAAEVSKQASIA